MSFRLTNIHDYHRFISIDLGLYRVRVGVYDVAEGKLSCIGFSSMRQSRKNWINGEVADIGSIAQSIEQAILQASVSISTPPDDIIMSFPSRSFISDSITSQYSRSNSDVPMTMQDIDMMIKRIEKESFDRARTKSRKQFGKVSDDLRLVSSTIISVSIDGRSVTSPIGFTGERVRLTVLNVFVPSSEFNVIRSIISRLGKRAISLIPEPLILPKIVEESQGSKENTCLVDIGYGHTTVTILQNNEVRGFETFPYGSEILMEMLATLESGYSLLQIENIMCSPEAFHTDKYKECLEEFLSYIRDAIFGYLQSEHIDVTLENIYLHGNIFENSSISTRFTQLFHDSLGYEPNTKHLHEIYTEKIAHDHCVTTGLSLMANELLLVKKDPLVRILRYVLYQYE